MFHQFRNTHAPSDSMLVYYEDMVHDTRDVMYRIAEFFSVDRARVDQIDDAILDKLRMYAHTHKRSDVNSKGEVRYPAVIPPWCTLRDAQLYQYLAKYSLL